MSPYRREPGAVHRDVELLAALARADYSCLRLRGLRRAATALTALTSPFPWLRSLPLAHLAPRSIDAGLTTWLMLGLLTLGLCGVEAAYRHQRRVYFGRLSRDQRERIAADEHP